MRSPPWICWQETVRRFLIRPIGLSTHTFVTHNGQTGRHARGNGVACTHGFTRRGPFWILALQGQLWPAPHQAEAECVARPIGKAVATVAKRDADVGAGVIGAATHHGASALPRPKWIGRRRELAGTVSQDSEDPVHEHGIPHRTSASSMFICSEMHSSVEIPGVSRPIAKGWAALRKSAPGRSWRRLGRNTRRRESGRAAKDRNAVALRKKGRKR